MYTLCVGECNCMHKHTHVHTHTDLCSVFPDQAAQTSARAVLKFTWKKSEISTSSFEIIRKYLELIWNGKGDLRHLHEHLLGHIRKMQEENFYTHVWTDINIKHRRIHTRETFEFNTRKRSRTAHSTHSNGRGLFRIIYVHVLHAHTKKYTGTHAYMHRERERERERERDAAWITCEPHPLLRVIISVFYRPESVRLSVPHLPPEQTPILQELLLHTAVFLSCCVVCPRICVWIRLVCPRICVWIRLMCVCVCACVCVCVYIYIHIYISIYIYICIYTSKYIYK